MKFVAQRETILPALKVILPLTKKTTSFAICKSCLIRCMDDQLDIMATSLDTSIQANVPLPSSRDIQEEGIAVVDTALLCQVVSDLPKTSDIIFETAGNRLKIKCDKFESAIPMRDDSEFPTLNFETDGAPARVRSVFIVSAIQKTLRSVSCDGSRPEFTGSDFRITAKNNPTEDADSTLCMCSTDGHRLSLFEQDIKTDGATIPELIITAEAQRSILLMVKDLDCDVEISVSSNGKFIVSCEGVKLSASPIAGSFPDFSRVIPTAFDYVATVDKDAFSDAVGIIEHFRDKKSGLVKLHLDRDDITISANTEKTGEASRIVSVDNTEGKPTTVGVNSDYVQDALDSIRDTHFIIKTIDSESPILITGLADKNIRQIIMPMQI